MHQDLEASAEQPLLPQQAPEKISATAIVLRMYDPAARRLVFRLDPCRANLGKFEPVEKGKAPLTVRGKRVPCRGDFKPHPLQAAKKLPPRPPPILRHTLQGWAINHPYISALVSFATCFITGTVLNVTKPWWNDMYRQMLPYAQYIWGEHDEQIVTAVARSETELPSFTIQVIVFASMSFLFLISCVALYIARYHSLKDHEGFPISLEGRLQKHEVEKLMELGCDIHSAVVDCDDNGRYFVRDCYGYCYEYLCPPPLTEEELQAQFQPVAMQHVVKQKCQDAADAIYAQIDRNTTDPDDQALAQLASAFDEVNYHKDLLQAGQGLADAIDNLFKQAQKSPREQRMRRASTLLLNKLDVRADGLPKASLLHARARRLARAPIAADETASHMRLVTMAQPIANALEALAGMDVIDLEQPEQDASDSDDSELEIAEPKPASNPYKHALRRRATMMSNLAAIQHLDKSRQEPRDGGMKRKQTVAVIRV